MREITKDLLKLGATCIVKSGKAVLLMLEAAYILIKENRKKEDV